MASTEQIKTVSVKIAISAIVFTLIYVQHGTPFINRETFILLLVALLPWLSTIVDSIEFPGGGKLLFKQVHKTIESQQRIINQLVLYSMSYLIFQHLSGIYHAKRNNSEYLFQGNLDAFRKDLRFLRDNGYLHHFHVGELQDHEDLALSLHLTPAGNFFVETREAFEHKQKEQIAQNLPYTEKS